MGSTPARIYVLDDDPDFLALMRWMLEQHAYTVECYAEISALFQRLNKVVPDVILLDRHLHDRDGLELIQPLRERLPNVPVVLVTATATIELAIHAIRVGAFDFLAKPVEEARLLMMLTRAVEHRRLLDEVAGGGKSGAARFEEMVGASPQMRTIYHIINNVAPTDVPVMIHGESGTGKELIARAIHRRSGRDHHPFVPINMVALPRELVESSLFGHEKGAFTSADHLHIGACEEAKGGTLFLDEVGEMPLELQPKLLRFLQERVFRRVGGNHDIPADARIVSATNRDPLAAVHDGRLRADLFYRLNVVPIHVPPLRNRRGDIPLLATSALHQIAERRHKNFMTIADEVMRRLLAYDWPGNVRELLNLIERMVVLNDGPVLRAAMLPSDFVSAASAPPRTEGGFPESALHDGAVPEPPLLPLTQLERHAIENALRVCRGNAAEAARSLGLSPATIYRKLKTYGIDVHAFA